MNDNGMDDLERGRPTSAMEVFLMAFAIALGMTVAHTALEHSDTDEQEQETIVCVENE